MIIVNKKYKNYIEVLYKEEIYEIEYEIFAKYRLKNGMDISILDWNEMIKENKYYYYDRISKNKLKKLLTEKELRVFLQKNGADSVLINELITKYLQYKYIDDLEYTRLYINSRKDKDGPRLLLSKLKDKGISADIINAEIKKTNEDESILKNISNAINKNINKNKKQLKVKIMNDLIVKGYTRDKILPILEMNLNLYNIDESKLLKKEYEKLYSKYKNKKSGYELNILLKTKLYQKGYTLSEIENIISDENA